MASSRAALFRTASLGFAAAALLACSPEEDQQQAADAIAERLGGLGDVVADISESGGPGLEFSPSEVLLAEAEQAGNLGRDAEAHGAYDRALALYVEAGDFGGQGRALLGKANLTRYSGQGEVSREIYAAARAAFAEAGDELGEAKVVFAIAELERARFYNEEALAAFNFAADIFRGQGEWGLEAQALLGIGDIERRLNRIFAADNAVSRARAIFEIIGDRSGQRAANDAWEELLTHVSETDDLRLGLAYDIGFADAGGSRLREAQGYLGMGILDIAAGPPSAARASFENARAVFEDMRLANGVFDAWAGMGELERRLGHGDAAREAYTKALVAYEQARARTSRESLEHEETANGSIAVRAALVLIARGELDRAAGLDPNSWFDQARALSSQGSSAQVDGALLIGRGGLYRRQGRLEDAAAALAEAAEIFSNAGLSVGAGQARLARAELAIIQENQTGALALFASSLDDFLVARDRIGEGDARWAWAQALAALPGNEMAANIQYRIAARIFKDLELPGRAAAALAAAEALN